MVTIFKDAKSDFHAIAFRQSGRLVYVVISAESEVAEIEQPNIEETADLETALPLLGRLIGKPNLEESRLGNGFPFIGETH